MTYRICVICDEAIREDSILEHIQRHHSDSQEWTVIEAIIHYWEDKNTMDSSVYYDRQ